MGFGIKVDVKAAVPKVELPKVDDVAKAVGGAVSAATGALTGALDSAKSAAAGAVSAATGAVSGALAAAEGVVASLASVPGAIADEAVSFTGAIEDFVLEPHLQLDANASWGDTKFEKGPVRIRIELTPAQAAENTETLRLFSDSGSYDESARISEYADSTGTTVLVVFEDAPMNETFSLQVIPAQGEPHMVFTGVSYGDLRKTKRRFVE